MIARIVKRLWYYYLRASVYLTSRGYYRKVEVNGMGNVPRTGALLLGVRHSNALMDPLMTGAFVPRVLHFLVRADVFASPFARWLWGTMNMMPIYRLHDGRNKMGRNQKTFNRCFHLLQKGHCIEIFPEGGHSAKQKLEPLKKGAARIVIGALENMTDTDVHVLPVGLNYSDERAFRAKLSVNVGPPISGRQYFNAEDPLAPVALTKLTKALETGIRPQVLDLRKPAPYSEMNTIRQILENHVHGVRLPQFAFSKQLTESLVNASGKDETRERLLALEKEHAALHKKLRLPLPGLPAKPISTGSIWGKLLLNLIFILVFPMGTLLHAPMLIPASRAHRLVKDPIFYSALRFIAGMFLTQILYLLYFLVVALVLETWGSVFVFMAGLVLSGVLALRGYDALRDISQLLKIRGIVQDHPADAQRLRTLQKEMQALIVEQA
ncbi:MAG: 1-acyl-sn-glycerol-3-phosphate acyltransferase [Bacteroidota bacterium]